MKITDRMRLDWLDKSVDGKNGYWCSRIIFHFNEDGKPCGDCRHTPRKAIDAAIRTESKRKGGK